jgi:hypothetical protein
MSSYTHPRLESLFSIVEILAAAARDLAREAGRQGDVRKPRGKIGTTLRPSTETPLWNALALATQPHLRRRGDRALLARELCVHRARIGEYFDRRTAMPDAERALELLLWLSRQPTPAEDRKRRNVRITNIGD